VHRVSICPVREKGLLTGAPGRKKIAAPLWDSPPEYQAVLTFVLKQNAEGICTVMKFHNCFIKCRKHPLLTGPLDMLLFTINKVCTLHQLGR
jgi:hypothetical protein